MIEDIYPGFDESQQSIMIEKDIPEFRNAMKEVTLIIDKYKLQYRILTIGISIMQ